MAAEIAAIGPPPPVGPVGMAARGTLADWKNDLTMIYLGAVLTAFLAGRLHALVQGRSAQIP